MDEKGFGANAGENVNQQLENYLKRFGVEGR